MPGKEVESSVEVFSSSHLCLGMRPIEFSKHTLQDSYLDLGVPCILFPAKVQERNNP